METRPMLSAGILIAVLAAALTLLSTRTSLAEPPPGPIVCVLTIDCGGCCGSERMIRVFERICEATKDPVKAGRICELAQL